VWIKEACKRKASSKAYKKGREILGKLEKYKRQMKERKHRIKRKERKKKT
jgi:hypothetical protein